LIVLDASVVVELLLVTPLGKHLAERFRSPERSLHAPHLLDIEVTQAVRRYVLAGAIPVERGHLALEHLAQLDLERYPHTPLLPRIWALRQNLTAYDATYVALAEVLEAPLLTTDARLARASGTVATIELL
jgi:predicted nucleic acid-binding protein